MQEEEALVFDDFQLFRSEIGRICKKMAEDGSLRAIFYVRRNLRNSPLRQLEYVIELTSIENLVNVSNLVEGKFATPIATDFPESEEKVDETRF